jgi:hypothetical protein
VLRGLAERAAGAKLGAGASEDEVGRESSRALHLSAAGEVMGCGVSAGVCMRCAAVWRNGCTIHFLVPDHTVKSFRVLVPTSDMQLLVATGVPCSKHDKHPTMILA